MNEPEKASVAIIGAGPAGLAAACALAQAGLEAVTIFDECSRPGGRLRGQLYEVDGQWKIGQQQAAALERQARDLGVRILSGRQVWSVEPGFSLALDNGQEFVAQNVLVATGAAERSLSIPGWTLPGVYAMGAVQSLLNIYRVLPGQRIAVVGIDPLSLSVLAELKLVGAAVLGAFLPPQGAGAIDRNVPRHAVATLGGLGAVAPHRLLRKIVPLLNIPIVASMVASCWPRSGLTVAGQRLSLRQTVVAIEGQGKVESIRVRSVDSHGQPFGQERRMDVDAVCLSAGLYPLQDLTALCTRVDVPDLGGLVPLHGSDMESDRRGLFVAGNVTGIESAAVAEAQGQLAAQGILAKYHPSLASAGALERAKSVVVRERGQAMVSFLPRIAAGREELDRLWQEHQRKRTSGGSKVLN